MEKIEEAVEVRPRGEEEGSEDDGEGSVLSPWEQHSSVISLPRFDYRTPALLLEKPYSGFLITCPIKREKSATKEAISIIEKLCFRSGVASENFEPSDSDVATKKRKVCLEETNKECASSTYKNDVKSAEVSPGQIGEDSNISHSNASEMVSKLLNLSLVKLTRSGLLLFTFTPDRCISTVDILSRIFHSLGSGKLKSPLWCHRIFPIQETCILNENNLSVVVSKLVQYYLVNEHNELKRPVKFAVGYNRRGLEQMQIKNKKSTVEVSDAMTLLDRDQCFKVVAKAVKDVIVDSTVDLKSPELAVLVELLPISGVVPESPVAGVSILPHNLITTKPRLSVKALMSVAKATKRNV
uniref:THUMP domain-containing protein 1 n=1 Tax=Anthurium amnicola TaxID=1678845 RepID=A0A1D1ZBW7_9ARAE